MKTDTRILRRLMLCCSIFTTLEALAQTTYVWTNQNPLQLTAGDLNQATNWSANGVPRPDVTDGATYGDEMLFDGQTTGPLAVTQNGSVQVNGAGTGKPYGLRLHLTANQTESVTLYSAVTVSAGMRMNSFTVDSGSGGLVLGDHSGSSLAIIAGVLNGQSLGFTNNSSTPSVINESVRWTMGGCGAHLFIFAGTGDWLINNHMAAYAGCAILLQKEGPGTMTWTGTNNANSIFYGDGLGNPVRINGGTMVLKSSDLLTGGVNIVHNGVLLKYDCSPAPGIITTPATNRGTISGSGAFEVSASVLTLAATSSYGGATTVSGGKLVFQGTKTGTGDITVLDGATLGVFDTGTQVTPVTLTLGANTGANLEFNNVHSTTAPIIVAGTLSSAGTNTIIINSGTFSVGQSYPLLTWTSGTAPAVSLAPADGFASTLSISGNTLFLNVSAITAPSLSFVQTGNSLQLSWNTNFGTYHLQSQTNDLNVGLNTNWEDYSGGATTPVNVPIDTMNESVFFRLVSP